MDGDATLGFLDPIVQMPLSEIESFIAPHA